ncbi:MAG TPA: cytochrome b [Stellaceae bacterium]|nr:cytochrome b [Stellaceae bacterium]
MDTDRATRSPGSYDSVMRVIHWTTLLLVAAVFVAVWIADPRLVGRANAALIVQIHRSLGLTVWALTVFRLAWRWRARVPALPADLPRMQKWAARANEALIYLLLLVQPVVGLLYSNAYGVRVDLFLLVPLPPAVARNLPLGEQLGGLHDFLGYSLLALVGAHAAAALFHHFIRQDDVLNAMLPARLRNAGRAVFALGRPKRQT